MSTTQSSSFLVRDQRERLLAAFADLVVERGLAEVSLEDLAARAGVELDTVHSYFDSEEECAFAATQAAAEQCFSAAAEAFMSTSGDCPMAARAALGAMLRYFAGAPSFVHLVVVEHPRLGQRARSLRHRYMATFEEFLVPGFAAAGELPTDPKTLSLLIAGGIFDLLSRHYLDGRLELLPDALPTVAYFTVAPFFGLTEAARVASVRQPDVTR